MKIEKFVISFTLCVDRVILLHFYRIYACWIYEADAGLV